MMPINLALLIGTPIAISLVAFLKFSIDLLQQLLLGLQAAEIFYAFKCLKTDTTAQSY